MVNNHGDSFRPLRIGLWDPFQIAQLHGVSLGVIHPNHLLSAWDDPPGTGINLGSGSVVFRSSMPQVARNVFGCRIFCRLLEQSATYDATQELIGKVGKWGKVWCILIRTVLERTPSFPTGWFSIFFGYSRRCVFKHKSTCILCPNVVIHREFSESGQHFHLTKIRLKRSVNWCSVWDLQG